MTNARTHVDPRFSLLRKLAAWQLLFAILAAALAMASEHASFPFSPPGHLAVVIAFVALAVVPLWATLVTKRRRLRLSRLLHLLAAANATAGAGFLYICLALPLFEATAGWIGFPGITLPQLMNSAIGAVAIMWLLQFLRPWRRRWARFARLVAAATMAISLTQPTLLGERDIGWSVIIIIILLAFALISIVIRGTDASWERFAPETLPDAVRPLRILTREPQGSGTQAATSTVGIALSGGGYRASLFALGALMYIRDACESAATPRIVSTISSVSGGSVTNAAMAHGSAFSASDRDAFDRVAQHLLFYTTGPGSMFAGRAARFYYIVLLPAALATVLALLAIGLRLLPLLPLGLASLWIALALLTTFEFPWQRRSQVSPELTPPDRRLLLIVASPFSLLLFNPATRPTLAIIAAVLLLAGGLAFVWSLRGWLIERTIKGSLDGVTNRPVLSNMLGNTYHVLCATEAQSGETVYFAHDAVRLSAQRTFAPDLLATARAVCASAAFPLAFPPVFLRVPWLRPTFDPRDEHDSFQPKFSRNLVLVDGGVRDNLGVRWFEDSGKMPENLIVVSASPNRHRRAKLMLLPGLSELAAIFRIGNLPYNVRERLHRRTLQRMLYSRQWTSSLQATGAVIHIEDSPCDLPMLLLACRQRETFTSETAQGIAMPDWAMDQKEVAEELWSAADKHAEILAERSHAALDHLYATEQKLPLVDSFPRDLSAQEETTRRRVNAGVIFHRRSGGILHQS